ncbi:MAG: condensation domain-containing protein, partial [Pseudonocardiaceae bacterium]
VLDRREGQDAEQREWLRELLRQDRVREFDLAEAPLLRLTVVRLAVDRLFVLWTFHHLLLDVGSAEIVRREVLALYRATTEGGFAELADPLPFYRYAKWLTAEAVDGAHRFWADYLDGVSAPTPLGIERRRRDEGFDEITVSLDTALARQVKTFARANDVTMGTVLHGAWALLLSRYSGHDDIVYGVTVSGRRLGLPGIESMVGLLVNTVPSRVRIDPDVRVDRWLTNLERQQAELSHYGNISLVDIKKHADIPPVDPLFSCVFVCEEVAPRNSSVGASTRVVESRYSGTGCTGYPLTIIAKPCDDAIETTFSFDVSLLEPSAVRRLARHMCTALADLVGGASRLGDVGIVSEAERRTLMSFGRTGSVDIDSGSLAALVERWVQATPDAVAVVCGEQSLTYRELDARANQLARVLLARGVGAEVVVGVCLERSLEMVMALLGVLKAGGGYLPLDPDYPVDRINFMITDSAAALVLTSSELAERLPTDPAHTLLIDHEPAIASAPRTPPHTHTNPNNLAYVIYTSGSTGTPKGVA